MLKKALGEERKKEERIKKELEFSDFLGNRRINKIHLMIIDYCTEF